MIFADITKFKKANGYWLNTKMRPHPCGRDTWLEGLVFNVVELTLPQQSHLIESHRMRHWWCYLLQQRHICHRFQA